MKKCPQCNRTFPDDTLSFCLEDGAVLSPAYVPDETLVMSEVPTVVQRKGQTRDDQIVQPQASSPLVSYLLIALIALLLGGGIAAVVLYRDNKAVATVNNTDAPRKQDSTSPQAPPSTPTKKVYQSTNVALHKDAQIVSNNTEEDGNNCNDASEITDGLFNVGGNCRSDGIVGFKNNDYGEVMTVTVTIDLERPYLIEKIRYNSGNVQHGEAWNADVMISPFGQTATNKGSFNRGAWTEQSGELTASDVTVTFKKTRRSETTDWIFIGEIEVIGVPAE